LVAAGRMLLSYWTDGHPPIPMIGAEHINWMRRRSDGKEKGRHIASLFLCS